jgi:hypothetical protein
MSTEFFLYQICRRADALVASQLPPEEFGAYMATGTQKQTSGRVIFLEVDQTKLPTGYFDMERARRETVARPDGSPKRSKYVSIYRSMEHVPTAAFGSLYLVTRDGRSLRLEASKYDEAQEQAVPNLYLELCPVYPLVASSRGPRAFLRTMTDPGNPMRVPRLLFADLLIDRDDTGSLTTYLPYKDPEHIVECLKEVMQDDRRKPSKTVDRTPALSSFYRCIRRGFFLGDFDSMVYYRYPSREEMEDRHHMWWRSASLGD